MPLIEIDGADFYYCNDMIGTIYGQVRFHISTKSTNFPNFNFSLLLQLCLFLTCNANPS